MRLGGEDEVGGDEFGALVEQLEEGVLGIGGGLTKEDGSGGVLDILTGAGDGFAVGLHGELLEVGGEAVQVLVERSNQVCLRTKEVGIPHTQETTDDGNVLL